MPLPGVGLAWAGVGEADAGPVGTGLGVANWNNGVADGPGVTVDNPLSVGIGAGLGGFCQI